MSKEQASERTSVLNTLINKLGVELHIPGYRFCGPGTKLQKRLLRGDKPLNPLDEACKQHDIAYSKYNNLEQRHKADKELATQAFQRVKSADATFGEKLAALGVTAAMKAKVKLGAGCKTKRSTVKKKRKVGIKKGGLISFQEVMKKTRSKLKNKNPGKLLKKDVTIALRAAKKYKNKLKQPRVISVPKTGGVLPLLPIFAGLSALGALSGGVSNIIKTINEAKAARDQLKESQRHNSVMESVKLGEGLEIKPYKKGLGLYLYKPSKNYQ